MLSPLGVDFLPLARMRAQKKPHSYDEIAVWRKEDCIWKNPPKALQGDIIREKRGTVKWTGPAFSVRAEKQNPLLTLLQSAGIVG